MKFYFTTLYNHEKNLYKNFRWRFFHKTFPQISTFETFSSLSRTLEASKEKFKLNFLRIVVGYNFFGSWKKSILKISRRILEKKNIYTFDSCFPFSLSNRIFKIYWLVSQSSEEKSEKAVR